MTLLQDTDMTGADCAGTLFSWSPLQRVKLDRANLSGTRFEKSHPGRGKPGRSGFAWRPS